MATKQRGRARNNTGTVSERLLADGKTKVYDAWTPAIFDPEKGKVRRIPKKGFPTAADAQTWIGKTVAELEAGERAIARQGGPTVDDVAETWAKSSPLKPSTVADHLKNYKRMASPHIGKLPIREVRSTDIDRMFAALNERYSAGVMVLLVRALGNIWDYAVRDEIVSTNVISKSPWRQKLYRMEDAATQERRERKEDEEGGLIKVFTPEQARVLLEMEHDELYRYIWEFVLLTGVRRGEACGLRWANVNFDKATIWLSDNTVHAGGKLMTVDTPKGNRRRRIVVAPEVLDLLRKVQRFIERKKKEFGDEWEDHDLVFPRTFRHRLASEPIGGRLNPRAVSETFLRRCRSRKLPEITFHGLRHSCASAMYRNGVDIKTIQDLFGHRIDFTTLVYVHTEESTKREAVTRVVDYYRAP